MSGIAFSLPKGFGTAGIPESDSNSSQVALAYSVHVGEKIAVRNEHLHDCFFLNRAEQADC